MKRRATTWPDYRASDDLPEPLSAAQFAGIGKVAILYNEAERMLDWVLFTGICSATGVTHRFWTELTVRINGIDGKLEIARKAIKHWKIEAPLSDQMIETLSAFSECKGYRDSVIHARVLDAKAGIGARLQRRAEIIEVLLTEEALEALAKRLLFLRDEMLAMAYIMQAARLDTMTTRGISWKGVPSRSEGLPDGTARFHKNRTLRRNLPPLPTFPVSPPILKSRQ